MQSVTSRKKCKTQSSQQVPTGDKVNNANFVKTDITATNGLVNVINSIVMPK
jgi:uncharacterized surface protein with fasciclin (FAS1) repeats